MRGAIYYYYLPVVATGLNAYFLIGGTPKKATAAYVLIGGIVKPVTNLKTLVGGVVKSI